MLSRMLGKAWYRSLVFWGLFAISLTLAGVMLYTYRGYRSAATNLVLERDQQLALLSGSRLREEIYNFTDPLVALARTGALAGGENQAKVKELKAAAPRLATFDAGVVLMSSRGVVLAAEPPRPALIGLDWSGREFFKGLLLDTQVYVSDAVFDGPDESLVIVISVPVLGESGEFEGALAGMFQLGETSVSSFYASIVRLRLGRSGDTYVVDGNSRIIYDTSSERISRFLTSNDLALLQAESSNGASIIEDEGRTVVSAYAPVPGTKWTLVTEDDWDVLTSQTRRYSNILVLSMLAGFLLPPLGLVIFSQLTRRWRIEQPDPIHDQSLLPTVQKELRPKQMPTMPGWNLIWRTNSMRLGGRDFFDSIIRPDGRMVISHGYVRMPGIRAALSLSTARAMLRAGALQMLQPVEALIECNRLLCSDQEKPIDVHCQFILIEPTTGGIEYCGAGVNDTLVYRRESIPSLAAESQPLGRNLELKPVCNELTLDPGQAILILSRSILEARTREGKTFANEVLPDLMRKPESSMELMADKLLAAYRSSIDRRQRKEQGSLLLIERLQGDGDWDDAAVELTRLEKA